MLAFYRSALRGFVIVLVLCLPCVVRTQQIPAEVSGTVTDGHGAPLAHLRVVLGVVDSAGAPAAAETDGAGVFHLPAEPGRTYQLRVEAPGFAPFAEAVTGGSQVGVIALSVARVDENVTVEGFRSGHQH